MARADERHDEGPGARWAPGTVARAVALVNRYGDELEYDLHAELGLDLADWLRGRHAWGKLLRLAAQLPLHSRYQAAVHDDDDAAEQLLDRLDGESAPATPRRDLTLVGWTPEREVLVTVAESVRDLHATLIAANSKTGKRRDPKALPRPRTALERVRRHRNVAAAQAVTAAFNPPGGGVEL